MTHLRQKVLSEGISNPLDEPLPTAAEVPHAQLVLYLPATSSLPTLCVFITELPGQLSLFLLEALPVESELPISPTLKTLLTAPLRKHLHADLKISSVDPTATT